MMNGANYRQFEIFINQVSESNPHYFQPLIEIRGMRHTFFLGRHRRGFMYVDPDEF